jgi:hypothetical protein
LVFQVLLVLSAVYQTHDSKEKKLRPAMPCNAGPAICTIDVRIMCNKIDGREN